MAVNVLGIDLSLTCTGLAFVQDGRVEWTQTIKSTGKKGDTLRQRETRIYDIVNQIRGVTERWEPALAVIESPSFGSVHGSAHDRSGLWWGTVRALFRRHIAVAQVSPMQRAKYGTGKGNSAKGAVHMEVKETYGRDDLPIFTNDEADAVLLAAMGARHFGEIVEEYLTDMHLAAMDKVVWP